MDRIVSIFLLFGLIAGCEESPEKSDSDILESVDPNAIEPPLDEGDTPELPVKEEEVEESELSFSEYLDLFKTEKLPLVINTVKLIEDTSFTHDGLNAKTIQAHILRNQPYSKLSEDIKEFKKFLNKDSWYTLTPVYRFKEDDKTMVLFDYYRQTSAVNGGYHYFYAAVYGKDEDMITSKEIGRAGLYTSAYNLDDTKEINGEEVDVYNSSRITTMEVLAIHFRSFNEIKTDKVETSSTTFGGNYYDGIYYGKDTGFEKHELISVDSSIVRMQ